MPKKIKQTAGERDAEILRDAALIVQRIGAEAEDETYDDNADWLSTLADEVEAQALIS